MTVQRENRRKNQKERMITQMHKMISFSSSSSLKKGLHEHVLNFLPADTINSGGLTRETLTKHQTQCTVAETKYEAVWFCG